MQYKSQAWTVTIEYKIWMAGDFDQARHVCRKFCEPDEDGFGFCVNIMPTTYIYTGGEETGFCVTLINYPRFPLTEEQIEIKAMELAELLRDELCQDSFTIQDPQETYWYSRRDR